MSVITKFLEELQSYEILDEEKHVFTSMVEIGVATDILQRFEVALIEELDCDELEKLKQNKYGNKELP